MHKLEYEELCDLLRFPEAAVVTYLKGILSQYNYKLYHEEGKYLFAVPLTQKHTPVCLVAHMDTVRSEADFPVDLSTTKETVFNKRGVLGADDRAGISVVLQLLRRLKELPFILFTHGEEVGCKGAHAFADSKIWESVLYKINTFIEYDRRGWNELVTYSYRVPEELKALFLAVGYEEKLGSTSDVAVVSNKTGLSHVNLSAGYIDQHTSSETLFPRALDFAVQSGLEVIPWITKAYPLDPPKTNTAYLPPQNNMWGMSGTTYGVRHPQKCRLCSREDTSVQWRGTIHANLCPSCYQKAAKESVTGFATPVSFNELLRRKEKQEKALKDLTRSSKQQGMPRNACPRCNLIAYKIQGSANSYKCTCGCDFHIEKDKKVWYSYIHATESTNGGWKVHEVSFIEQPLTTIPSSCELCGKESTTYYFPINGKYVWGCKKCLIEAKKAKHISWAQYRTSIRAREKIPF